VIHNDIAAMLGSNIVGESTATSYFREVKFPLSAGEASGADNRKPINDTNESTLSDLNESLFTSVRQLSRFTHLRPTIVYRHPAQSPGSPGVISVGRPMLCQTRRKLSG
jgi:hypothetical protein